MARYSNEFKERAVARLLPPESADISRVSQEIGVSVAKLERWRAEAPLEAVIATAAMDEAQRSAWCREKGVFPSDLAQWRESAMAALAQPEEARATPQETRQDRRRIKELETELQAQGEGAGGDHGASCTRKKTRDDLPCGRGRMISLEDRQSSVRAVEEAHRDGARLRCACADAGITVRTLAALESLRGARARRPPAAGRPPRARPCTERGGTGADPADRQRGECLYFCV